MESPIDRTGCPQHFNSKHSVGALWLLPVLSEQEGERRNRLLAA